MTIDLGSAVLRTGADLSGLSQGLDRAGGMVNNFASKGTSLFQKMGAVMGGVLGAQAVTGAFNSLKSLGSEALNAYAAHEKLSMSLESLVARDIRLASAQTATAATGKVWVAGAAAQVEKLDALKLKQEEYRIALLKAEYQLNAISQTQKKGDIDYDTSALKVAKLKNSMADLDAQMSKLGATQGHYATTTSTSTKYTLTLEQAMAQSKGQAKELLGWISELAIKSPFDAEGVAAALRMQMAYGSNITEAKRLTQALIDFSAASGGSTEGMQRISLALGQMQAKGKVSGEEMRQLTEAGLPVGKILAEAFGKSTAELENLQKKGLLPAKTAIEAITTYLETNFKGAAEKQATSWAGLLSSFKEIKTIALREFFSGTFEAIQPLAALLVDTLANPAVQERIRAFGDVIGGVVAGLVGKITTVIDVVSALKRGVDIFAMYRDMGQGPADAIRNTLDVMAKFYPAMQPALEALDVFMGGFKKLFDPGGEFASVAGIAAMQTGLATLGQQFGLSAEAASLWAARIAEAIQQAVPTLQTIAGAFDTFKIKFGELKTAFETGGLPAVTTLLSAWATELVTYITTNAPLWGAQIKTAIAGLWDGFKTWWDTGGGQLTTDVIGKVSAFVTGIVPWIQARLPDWAGTLMVELGKLWDGFKTWWDTGGAQLTTDVLAKLGTFIFGLIDGYVTRIPEWTNALLAAVGVLWQGFVSWWDSGGGQLTLDVIGKIGTFITDLLGKILAAIPGWATTFATTMATLWETLKTWWDTDGARIAGEVAAKIGEVIKQAFELLKQNLPSLGEALGKILGTVIGIALDLLTGLVELGIKLVKFIIGLFSEDKAAGPVGDSWGKAIIKAMGNAWAAFIDALVATGPDWLVDLIAWFDKLFADLAAGVAWIKALVESGKQLIDGLKQGIDDTAKSVSSAILGFVTANITNAVKWLSALQSAGGNLVSGLKTGVNNMAKTMSSAVVGFVTTNIANAVKWAEVLVTAGNEIVAGLKKGVSDKIDDVKKFIESWINSLPQAVKDLLGISSPSKVFAAIGQQIPAGLAQGIQQAAPGPLDVIDALLQKLIGLTKGKTEHLQDAFGIIAASINAALVSLSALANYRGGSLANLTAFIDEWQKVITAMQSLAWRFSKNSKAIADFSGRTADILNGFDILLQTLPKFDAITQVTNLAQKLKWLQEAFAEILLILLNLATKYTQSTRSLIPFAQVIGAVVGAIQLIAGTIELIGTTNIYPVDRRFTTNLVANVEALVDACIQIAALPDITRLTGEVIYFSKAIGEVLAPFQAMIEFCIKLQEQADWMKFELKFFADSLDGVLQLYARLSWALELSMWRQYIINISKAAGVMLAGLSNLLAPFQAMIEFCIQLTTKTDWMQIELKFFADSLDGIMQLYARLSWAIELSMWRDFIYNTGEATQTMLTGLSNLLAPFQAMIEFCIKLRGQTDWMKFELKFFADSLEAVMQLYARLSWALELSPWRAALDTLSAETIALAGKLGGLIAPFSAMLDFWTKLNAGFKIPDTTYLVYALDIMATDLAAVAAKLTQLSQNPIFPIDALVSELAGKLGGLIAPFAAMLDFWTKLKTSAEVYPPNDTELATMLEQMYANFVTVARALALIVQDSVIRVVVKNALEVAGKLSQLLPPFAAMLDFWTKLKTAAEVYSPNDTELATMLEQMYANFVTVARALALIVQDSVIRVVVKNALEVAGKLSQLLPPFAAMLDFWTKLKTAAELTVPTVAEFAAMLAVMRDYYVAVGQGLVNIWQSFDWLNLVTICEYIASKLSGLLAPFTAMLDFWAKLNATDLRIKSDISGLLLKFEKHWIAIVESLVKIHKAVKDYVDDTLLKFAANVGAIADGLSKAVSLLANLSALSGINQVSENMNRLVGMLNTAMATLRTGLAGWSNEGIATANLFAGAVGSLMAALQAALNLISNAPKTWGVPAYWDNFILWVKATFEDFYDWLQTDVRPDGSLGYTDAGIDIVSAFADALLKLMDALKNAATFTIGDWVEPAEPQWTAFTNWIKATFDTFYSWLQRETADGTAYYTTGNINLISAFAGALNALMAGLVNAAKFSIEAWSAPNPVAWTDFITWVQGTFDTFYNWLTTATVGGTFHTTAGIELVSAFGAAISAVMGGLTSALNIVKDFDFTPPSATTWNSFTTWVQDTMALLISWVNTTYPNYATGANFEPVTSFGGAMTAVFGGLKAALDVFASLANYTAPTQTSITAFLDGVKGVMASIISYVTANITPTINDTVSGFAGAMTAVFNGLKNALSLFTDLSGMTGTEAMFLASAAAPNTNLPNNDSPFAQKVGYLIGAIQAVMTVFRTQIAGQYGPEWLAAAGDFQTSINAVFNTLKNALSVFNDLAGNVQPAQVKINEFLASVLSVMNSIGSYVTANITPAVNETVIDFSAAMTAVFDGLKGGLDLLAGLAALAGTTADFTTPGTATTFAARLGLMLANVDTVITFFTERVGTFTPTWTEAATNFETALNSVFLTLKTALEVFGTLGTTGLPSTQTIVDFIGAIVSLFSEFATAMGSVDLQINQDVKDIASILLLGSTEHFGSSSIVFEDMKEKGLTLGITLVGFFRAAIDPTLNYYPNLWDGLIMSLDNFANWISTVTLINGKSLPAQLQAIGADAGGKLIDGLRITIDPATGPTSTFTALAAAVAALTTYIESQVRATLGIASPSQVMADLAENIPLGLAQGILAGIPSVQAATAALAGAVAPGLGGLLGGNTTVDTRRHIIVDFRGEAGGRVPLTPDQFYQLKTDLTYALSMGG